MPPALPNGENDNIREAESQLLLQSHILLETPDDFSIGHLRTAAENELLLVRSYSADDDDDTGSEQAERIALHELYVASDPGLAEYALVWLAHESHDFDVALKYAISQDPEIETPKYAGRQGRYQFEAVSERLIGLARLLLLDNFNVEDERIRYARAIREIENWSEAANTEALRRASPNN